LPLLQNEGQLKWAATQNNLGSALLKLGERESNAARMEKLSVRLS
jgi:hypothetical protein